MTVSGARARASAIRPRVSFGEWLTGSFWTFDAPTDERAVDLTLELGPIEFASAMGRKDWPLTGIVDAERLATHRALEGTLSPRLLDERRVPYRIGFEGDDGRRYELSGEKEWTSLMPLDSVTLLRASLYDDGGEELGRATLRFDLRADWARWLKSFRIRL